MINRLTLVAVLAFLTSMVPCAAGSPQRETGGSCHAPVVNFNEVARTESTDPAVMDWFSELIELNPTAMVVWDDKVFAVISATNTFLVLPETEPPAEVEIFIE